MEIGESPAPASKPRLRHNSLSLLSRRDSEYICETTFGTFCRTLNRKMLARILAVQDGIEIKSNKLTCFGLCLRIALQQIQEIRLECGCLPLERKVQGRSVVVVQCQRDVPIIKALDKISATLFCILLHCVNCAL